MPNNAIWKWTLEVTGEQTLPMPEGAQILTVQVQNGAPQLWALVDSKAYGCWRTFATYDTVAPIPDEPGVYVGTYQMNGALVFHVFELNKEIPDAS